MEKENQEQKKREILNLDFSYNSREDIEEILQDEDLSRLLTHDLIEASKEVVNNDLKKIHLYDINNFKLKVEMRREQFKPSLEFIKKRFLKNEEFERCSEIQNIIDKL